MVGEGEGRGLGLGIIRMYYKRNSMRREKKIDEMIQSKKMKKKWNEPVRPTTTKFKEKKRGSLCCF